MKGKGRNEKEGNERKISGDKKRRGMNGGEAKEGERKGNLCNKK